MSQNLPVDPNTLICPDYTADEYATARADFTSNAITDALAAQILSKAWIITNNTDKAIWKLLGANSGMRPEQVRSQIGVGLREYAEKGNR